MTIIVVFVVVFVVVVAAVVVAPGRFLVLVRFARRGSHSGCGGDRGVIGDSRGGG